MFKWKELAEKAKAAILAGDTEGGKALKAQAEAMKELEELAPIEIATVPSNETPEFKALLAKFSDLETKLNAEPAQKAGGHLLVTEDETDKKAAKPFTSFGEQLVAVARAANNPRFMDERLAAQKAILGHNEQQPSEGGFLVQQDFSTELLRVTHETGIVSKLCRNIPISRNSNGIVINGVDETSRVNGSRWGGIRVYWEAEADTKTASKPKFRRLEFKLRKLIGLCYATDEMLEDSNTLEGIIREGFAEEMSFVLDDAIVRGPGGGMPLGWLNSPALVTVSKEAGPQNAATVVMANLTKMWSRMPARNRLRAYWFINQDIEPQLNALSLTVGNNSYPVYMPPGGLSGSQYSTLFGRPVIPIEQASTLGTVGDIMLVDPTQYGIIDKGGIQSATSIHVRFVNDETTFRFVLRVDGRPMWHAAMTPAQGTATKSPFVVLETRN